MGKELKWADKTKKLETLKIIEYMHHFGGPMAARTPDTARVSTLIDITDAFKKIDSKGDGKLGMSGIRLVAELLGHPCTEEELSTCFNHTGKKDMEKDSLSCTDFAEWWNSDSLNPGLVKLKAASNFGSVQY
jgi:hypothetical protein